VNLALAGSCVSLERTQLTRASNGNSWGGIFRPVSINMPRSIRYPGLSRTVANSHLIMGLPTNSVLLHHLEKLL